MLPGHLCLCVPVDHPSCNILLFILFFSKQDSGDKRKCPLITFSPQASRSGVGRAASCAAPVHPEQQRACVLCGDKHPPLPRASAGFCLAGGWDALSPPSCAEGSEAARCSLFWGQVCLHVPLPREGSVGVLHAAAGCSLDEQQTGRTGDAPGLYLKYFVCLIS